MGSAEARHRFRCRQTRVPFLDRAGDGHPRWSPASEEFGGAPPFQGTPPQCTKVAGPLNTDPAINQHTLKGKNRNEDSTTISHVEPRLLGSLWHSSGSRSPAGFFVALGISDGGQHDGVSCRLIDHLFRRSSVVCPRLAWWRLYGKETRVTNLRRYGVDLRARRVAGREDARRCLDCSRYSSDPAALVRRTEFPVSPRRHLRAGPRQ